MLIRDYFMTALAINASVYDDFSYYQCLSGITLWRLLAKIPDPTFDIKAPVDKNPRSNHINMYAEVYI